MQGGAGFGFASIGGKQISKKIKGASGGGGNAAKSKQGGSAGPANLAAAEEQDVTNEDVIKNVQNMLKQEKVADKAQAKKGAKIVSFDLNEGIVGATYYATSSYTKTSSGGGASGEGSAG